MIKNLQDELYLLENKQAKGAKLHANDRWELMAKNPPKLFSNNLKDWISKIRPYLNFILIIINQNIIAILRTF